MTDLPGRPRLSGASAARGGSLLAIVALAIVACGTPFSVSAQALQIDLCDPDPPEIQSLPGILDAEASALREIAGPGSGTLPERLARTGIPLDRLQDWAPYLDLPASGPFASRWSVRSTVESRGTLAPRTRIAVRAEQAHWSGDLASSLSLSSGHASRSPGATLHGRFGARVPWGALIWVGALSAGMSGLDPWGDPLRTEGVSSSSWPRAGLSARSTARGLYLEAPRFSLGCWRGRLRERGGLLALRTDAGIAWLGAESKGGHGGGGAIRLGRVCVAAAVHAPRGKPAALRATADGEDGGFRVSFARSLSERVDGRETVVDGSVAKWSRSWHARMRSALRLDAGLATVEGRGAVGIAYREGSISSAGEVGWSSSERRVRIEAGRTARARCRLWMRVRGYDKRGRGEGLIEAAASLLHRSIQIEGGWSLRSASAVPFSYYAATDRAERAALRAGCLFRCGLTRFDLRVVAPLGMGSPGRLGPPFWRITLDQRALSPARTGPVEADPSQDASAAGSIG